MIQTIDVPRFAGKADLQQLQDLPIRAEDPAQATLPDTATLYQFERAGFRFDTLFHPKPGATRLFVLFSGDAMRSKYDPPVFQRWKWAPYFPGHCLYISDPALHLNPRLGLAWYAGTEAFDPMPEITQIISAVAQQLSVAPDVVWSYGSSGGGFASLRMLDLLPQAGAICINPQTNVTVYEQNSVGFYLRTCFGGRDRQGGLADFPRRLNLLGDRARFEGRRIIYVQNLLDTHHHEVHYTPFCQMMGVDPDVPGDAPPFARILFSDAGGHAKVENAKVFSHAIHLATG